MSKKIYIKLKKEFGKESKIHLAGITDAEIEKKVTELIFNSHTQTSKS